MARGMSKCPFWSTSKEKFECYKECPILASELGWQDSGKCIFSECTEPNNINFNDVLKEEYNFLDLSMYDEDKNIRISY